MKKLFKKAVSFTLAAAMSLTLFPTVAFASPTTDPSPSSANDNLLRIWYDKPATNWETEALAIGNGYMGAMIFGGINSDKIHLNEKTIWKGGPSENNPNYNYGNTNTDIEQVKADLNTIREKLEDKSEYVFGYDEDSYQGVGTGTKGGAMDDLNKLMGDLNGYSSPQDYADLYINNDIDESAVENYVRDLDMRTGLATVSYDYNGVHYTREYFNSYPDNVLVVRLTASKEGQIDFNTKLTNKAGNNNYSNVAEGDTITMKSSLSDNNLRIEGELKVLNEGGNLSTSGDTITVNDADSATLIFACGTDYKMELPDFRTGVDPHEAVAGRLSAAAEKGYEALKEDHIADHSALFSRMEIGFNEEIPQIPTDELIKKYRNMVDNNGGEVPTESEQRALEIICYQFGRYLTIAGSREGALPTNLQGVWGEGSFDWGGDYHFNINIQMNYWPTLASNLAECQIPYNDYLNVLRQAGRGATASAFGIESTEEQQNGWMVGCFSTPYMFATMGQKGNAAGWNPTGSAWALLNAYEYYLYTGDMDYLKDELYPSMKEVANFWNEALYWSESQQRYVSSPSYSPENGPIVAGASYDQQFIWQHFENTIAAAETLGVDEDLIAQWRDKQSKLDPVIVGDSGQIKEWYEETTFGKAQAGDLEEIDIPQWRASLGASVSGQEPPHRHLSHLMALYPGNMISKDNPEFMDAAMVTLNERGLDATGWSKAHKLNLWARTGHSEEAFQIVQSAVGGGNSGFLTNLFSSHGGGANYKAYPIFQIDGNFGYTAGVNEMLLQSQLGYIQFLPTLPQEWNTGFVKGMVARGNFEIDMDWADGVANTFTVTSRNGGEFSGEYKNIANATIIDAEGNPVEFTKDSNDRITFDTEKDGVYTISLTQQSNKFNLKFYLDKAEAVEDDVLNSLVESAREKFDSAVQNGWAVYNDANADQDTVDAAAVQLRVALNMLGMIAGDKTALNEAIAEANDLIANAGRDYPTAAVETLSEAVKAAQTVADDMDAFQGEVDEATQTLLNAIEAFLGSKLDWRGMDAALEDAANIQEGITAGKYTETGIEEFNEAYAAAQGLTTADSQETIDKAVTALLEASANLRFKADKSILKDLLNEAETIELALYTDASVADFKVALTTANEVYANESLSTDDQKTVDNAVETLDKAMAALELKESAVADGGDTTGTTDNTTSGSNNDTATNTTGTKTGDTASLPIALAIVVLAAGACYVFRKKSK